MVYSSVVLQLRSFAFGFSAFLTGLFFIVVDIMLPDTYTAKTYFTVENCVYYVSFCVDNMLY